MLVDGIEVFIVAGAVELALRCRSVSGGMKLSHGWLRRTRAQTARNSRTMTRRRRYQMLGGWCHHWENRRKSLACALW